MIKMTQTGFRELPETVDSFESNDLPVILAALKKAHDSKHSARVTIDFSSNGGVIAVLLEEKIKMK